MIKIIIKKRILLLSKRSVLNLSFPSWLVAIATGRSMGHQPSPPEFEGLEKRAEEEIGNLLISPFLTPGFEYLSTALPLAGGK